MEQECFYFLRLAAGERGFKAREFSLTVGNSPHALDCFSQIRAEADAAAPPLTGPLTQHACQSGPQPWRPFQHLHAVFAWTHVNLDGGLWSVTSPPTLPDPRRSER